jgi:hypothetical protein
MANRQRYIQETPRRLRPRFVATQLAQKKPEGLPNRASLRFGKPSGMYDHGSI